MPDILEVEQNEAVPATKAEKIAAATPAPPKDDIDFMGPFLSAEKCPIQGPEDEVCTTASDDEDEPEKESNPETSNPEDTKKGDNKGDDSSDEEEDDEEHWGWMAARYCAMGLITLAIIFDEMD